MKTRDPVAERAAGLMVQLDLKPKAAIALARRQLEAEALAAADKPPRGSRLEPRRLTSQPDDA